MATAYVTFGKPATTENDSPAPIYQGDTTASETVTTSGTSAQTTGTSDGVGVATIFCASALYALAGSNPTVTATNGRYIPANLPIDIRVEDGDKVALIDV